MFSSVKYFFFEILIFYLRMTQVTILMLTLFVLITMEVIVSMMTNIPMMNNVDEEIM